MPKTTITTVQQGGDRYYSVRVRRALGDALSLAGEEVEWEINSGDSLIVRKTDD